MSVFSWSHAHLCTADLRLLLKYCWIDYHLQPRLPLELPQRFFHFFSVSRWKKYCSTFPHVHWNVFEVGKLHPLLNFLNYNINTFSLRWLTPFCGLWFESHLCEETIRAIHTLKLLVLKHWNKSNSNMPRRLCLSVNNFKTKITWIRE